MSAQMSLWDDVRIPQSYLLHYKSTKLCLNCGASLRHELHAFNHWKKWHRKKHVHSVSKVRYFVWLKENQSWVECSMFQCLSARLNHRPTATSH